MGIRRYLARALAVSCALLVFLSLAVPAQAAERIQDYKLTVDINTDGRAVFSEQISYSFDAERHGITRNIPVMTQLPDKTYLVYKLSIEQVLRDGMTEPFTQASNGVYQSLKIGDPASMVSGLQNYKLEYQLEPIVRRDPKGDYISLTLVGTGSDVPTDTSSATVTLPLGLKAEDAKCYTGVQGVREQACSVEQSANVLTVRSTAALAAKQGLTLDLLLPANSFTAAAYNTPTQDGPKTGSNASLSVILFALFFNVWFLIPVILAVVFTVRWWQKRRGRKAQTVIPYYEPPDNLLPAEVGYITDDAATSVEITATIIHLATRGYLKLHYEEQKQLIGTKQRFRLEKLKQKGSLQDFETTLMSALFAAGPSVYIDDLDRQSMASTVKSIRDLLKERLRGKGLYNKQSKPWAPDATEAGYKEWAKVEGLKLYLSVTEKDRMKFLEAPDKTPARFSKLLPYAIALGVEQAWAAQFKDIDVASHVSSWYDGQTAMNSMLLSNVLSTSFSSAVSNNMTTPPSSSSGYSGGFSGGGAGGGSVGSW